MKKFKHTNEELETVRRKTEDKKKNSIFDQAEKGVLIYNQYFEKLFKNYD